MPEENRCVHCGADCGKTPVSWNGLSFCCNGCEQVYRLLNEKQLYTYYRLEDTPGVRIDNPGHGSRFAFLDREDIQEKLYSFHDDGIARVNLYIPAMHCASCIWLLENLNRLNSGVRHSSVNFPRKELSVTFDTKAISLRELVELLVSIHYIPDISLQTIESGRVESTDRSLLYKIGVAGFVFGNVMLYSLPEYFNGEPLGESLGRFLYYLAYILTFPLVFYAGSDYLISAFKNLARGIINIDLPIAMGILALFGVTSWEVISGTGPGYSDSLSGFLFFLLLGRWYQGKSYQALSFDRDYRSYFPVSVTRVDDGVESEALLREVSKGDTLVIRNRELIPADSIVLDGEALIDYSFVTGESAPVRKEPGEKVLAGGIQTAGAITIEVTKDVMQSHLTMLWNQAGERDDRSKLTTLTDRVSVYFTLAVILIALAGFTWWLLRDGLSSAVMVFTSVLIVACPCALALTVPFTFGNVMRILGFKGMYIRNSTVVERITAVDTVVFDKTGTITRPDREKVEFIAEGAGSRQLYLAVSLARQSTHPLSSVIVRRYPEIEPGRVEGFVEMAGRGLFGRIDGKEVKLGSCNFVTGRDDCRTDNRSVVWFSVDTIPAGRFVIGNFYREGFGEVMEELGREKSLFLLSGDNESERDYLSGFFSSDKMHFNQSPTDKMSFIENLQAGGARVMMTGDGLNDSGAFLRSDVAVSVADDIYHFSPASDAIVDAANFSHLPSYIRFCRRSLIIVRLSFAISLLYNIAGLSYALSGNLSPVVAAILMPASSVSVVAFATLATRLAGRSVGRPLNKPPL